MLLLQTWKHTWIFRLLTWIRGQQYIISIYRNSDFSCYSTADLVSESLKVHVGYDVVAVETIISISI